MQGRYWSVTRYNEWTPELPKQAAYIKGQKEIGNLTEREHWQIMVIFGKNMRRKSVVEAFGGQGHCELSKSSKLERYVWKEDTRIPGTQFEFGNKPIRRSVKHDWDRVWELAKENTLDDIPKSILVPHYRTIQAIARDYLKPSAQIRTINVYWGGTGLGKSRRAWHEAGMDAFPKDPRTKFWDGYRDQENVVIDEFRGDISISHMLRWTDRYPVIMEVKGSSRNYKVKNLWITSNIHPRDWWPDLDEETRKAVLRRMKITNFITEWTPPPEVIDLTLNDLTVNEDEEMNNDTNPNLNEYVWGKCKHPYTENWCFRHKTEMNICGCKYYESWYTSSGGSSISSD